MKKRLTILAIATLTTLALCCLPFHAKDEDKNRFNIDQSLYEIYTRAFKMMHDVDPRYPALSDSLFNLADSMHQVKAQCIALDLDCTYAMLIKPNDHEYIHQCIQRERDFAVNTPYTQYVFGGWRMYIINLINKNDMRCLDEISEFQREAFRLKDGYGMAHSYEFYAALYKSLKLYNSAITANAIAIDYQKQYGNPNELYRFYYNMGNLYFILKDYDNALVYLNKALESKYITKSLTLKSYSLKARIHYRRKNYKKFAEEIKYCEDIVEENQKTVTTGNKDIVDFLKTIYYVAVEKDSAKAMLACNDIEETETKNSALLRIYEETHNYEQAYKLKTKIEKNSNVSPQHHLYQISNIEKMRKKSEAELRQSEIEQANLKLSQHHAAMAANIAREQLELEEKNKQKSQLAVKAELDRIETLRHQRQQQQLNNETKILEEKERIAKLEVDQAQRQQQHVMISGILILTVIASTFCAAVIFLQNKRANAIQRQHAETLASLQHKDRLIDQIQHSIITPLQQIRQETNLFNPNQNILPQQARNIRSFTENITSTVDKLVDEK